MFPASKFLESTPGFEKLDNFLENASVGIHLVNKEGIIVYANKAELQLLGYTPEEYVGHSIHEFHAEQTVIEKILNKLLNNEELINYESTLKCKNGSLKEVLISSNVYMEDGKFKHTRCFTRDITKLKKGERLLRYLNKAGEELTATFDTSEALDKITNLIVPRFADWFIVNQLRDDGFAYLTKMAHVDPEKVVWAEKYRIKHPIDINDPQIGSVGWVMRMGEPLLVSHITDEIIEKGAKDAEQLEILKALDIKSVIMVPMQIKGKVTGVISFMSCNSANIYDDIDFDFAKDFANRIALTLENTRLYEKTTKEIQVRIEADKKKDEFISAASHELRTPITSLKAYAQVLQMTFEEQENFEASDMLAKMDKQINKLTTLISDLLDITKIDKGEMVFNIEEFDLNELVTEIAEEMQRTTTTHKINQQLGSLKKIRGDRNKISQVIVNFISNAIKYSPQANEIIINTNCIKSSVKLCVRDFGIGIPQEQKAKIFNRFYRATAKNIDTFPGLGLGLYISKEIINRHSGTITFESEEGTGSTFCFELNVPEEEI